MVVVGGVVLVVELGVDDSVGAIDALVSAAAVVPPPCAVESPVEQALTTKKNTTASTERLIPPPFLPGTQTTPEAF
ncbi:MAG: hypothetical protein WEE36_06550 [Acidimicrobiia bacterium]